MLQRIREHIRVGVIHGPGSRLRPVWFDWRRRKHEIREITYTWQERHGEATVIHFAVSDGANLFELAYDSVSRIWALTAVDEDYRAAPPL
jgi:hypothetical protein